MAAHISSTVYKLEEVWAELQRMKEAQDLNSAWVRISGSPKPRTERIFTSLHTLGTETFLPRVRRSATLDTTFPLPVRREVVRASLNVSNFVHGTHTLRSCCTSRSGSLRIQPDSIHYRGPLAPVNTHVSFSPDQADLAVALQPGHTKRIYIDGPAVGWDLALNAIQRIIAQTGYGDTSSPDISISMPVPSHRLELYVNVLEPGVFDRKYREEDIDNWRETAAEFERTIRGKMAEKRLTFEPLGLYPDRMDVKILADAPCGACSWISGVRGERLILWGLTTWAVADEAFSASYIGMIVARTVLSVPL